MKEQYSWNLLQLKFRKIAKRLHRARSTSAHRNWSLQIIPATRRRWPAACRSAGGAADAGAVLERIRQAARIADAKSVEGRQACCRDSLSMSAGPRRAYLNQARRLRSIRSRLGKEMTTGRSTGMRAARPLSWSNTTWSFVAQRSSHRPRISQRLRSRETCRRVGRASPVQG